MTGITDYEWINAKCKSVFKVNVDGELFSELLKHYNASKADGKPHTIQSAVSLGFLLKLCCNSHTRFYSSILYILGMQLYFEIG